ncbi:MAG: AbrB/MazE/SpoVT family DNA-binding domain-containing protein [Chloroflexota bacterium]
MKKMVDVACPGSLPWVRTKIDANGRVVVPSGFREALGIKPGEVLTMGIEAGHLTLMTFDQASKRACEIVRTYVPDDRSLVDELLADRRSEASRE